MAIDAAISGDSNVINKEAEKFLKYKDLNNNITVNVGGKNNSDPRNNKGNTFPNHSENTQQHTRKPGNQGTT